MNSFMNDNFLLGNPTSVDLFHQYAKEMPIFDFHCHLSPRDIWENKNFRNITEVWLGGDHYKWRQMRSMGISEELITGTNSSDKEKFMAWAKTVPCLIGNPLYHWTHLELRRYFGINETLNEKTAEMIWEKTNEMLALENFTPRKLIERSNVYAVCTTDDPADSLNYHQMIQAEGLMATKIIPAMRPDKALQPEAEDFEKYIEILGDTAQVKINSYADLKRALSKRISFFNDMGCRACDHAFNYIPFAPADDFLIEKIFIKGTNGEALTREEQEQYKTSLMLFLAKEYKKYNWVMEIHIGALRNNNKKMFDKLGADTGFDSVDDNQYAPKLAAMLSAMDEEGHLPKTILFTLNPKDYYVLTTLMGCFQGSEIASKIQNGSAWWFLDHKAGIEEQMTTLAATGILAKFVGMVTDSRSFLSYPRHEYFRRILCNLIGTWVENGEYPADMEQLGEIIQDICFNNVRRYIQ